MSAKDLIVSSLWLLLIVLPSYSFADGMVVANPSVYFHLIEDQQIAVITIKEDKTAEVNLFVSLIDTSEKSNEIKFILPFYENPTHFAVREEKIEVFESYKIKKLDELIKWKTEFEEKALNDLWIGNTFFGSYCLPYLFYASQFTLGSTIRLPEKIVTTEHTKTEIYKIGSQKELEEILKQSGLSENIKDKMRSWEKEYLYITTLHTIPLRKEKKRDKSDSLGILFLCRLNLKDSKNGFTYKYPLSTGQTWPNPIRLTKVYISAPYGIGLKIKFPKFGEEVDNKELTEKLIETRYSVINAEDVKSYCNIENVNIGDIKIYRGVYTFSNPTKDIKIVAFKTKFDLLAKIKTGLFYIIRPVILPILVILGLVIWVFLFKFIIGRRVNIKYFFKKKDIYIHSLGSWCIYFITPIFIWLIWMSTSFLLYLFLGIMWVLFFRYVIGRHLGIHYSLKKINVYLDTFVLGWYVCLINLFSITLWIENKFFLLSIFLLWGLGTWIFLFRLIMRRYKIIDYSFKKKRIYIDSITSGVLCSLLGFLIIGLYCLDFFSRCNLFRWLEQIFYEPVRIAESKFIPEHFRQFYSLTSLLLSLILPLTGIFAGCYVLKRYLLRFSGTLWWSFLTVWILTVILYNLCGFVLVSLFNLIS